MWHLARTGWFCKQAYEITIFLHIGDAQQTRFAGIDVNRMFFVELFCNTGEIDRCLF